MAGGKGLRFGGSVRKQYLLLNRRPIVWWSLAAFERSPSIEALILVAPADDAAHLRTQISSWKFRKPLTIVQGGDTRADSVRQGLLALPKNCRYVAVHDAVRPLVTSRLIEDVIAEARRCKAALAACPSKDTLKLSDAKRFVRHSPPRETVWLAQTPQVFERTLLERAHQKGKTILATDDAQLVERLRVKVRLVEAPAENIKITRPMDLIVAKMILGA